METLSPLSSPSSSRSRTDRPAAGALALLAALALSACGGDDGPDAGGELCGPGGVTDAVGVAPATSEPATFGQFHSSANNDCTAPGDGPTSLTIQGTQVDPADPARFLVLCLPSPDLIGQEPVSIADDSLVQLVDLVAMPADGCRVELDRDRAPSGTISFGGYCADGGDPAGYALSFDVQVPVLRTCGEDEPEAIEAALDGAAPVVADGV
jgi:hypothetical protein